MSKGEEISTAPTDGTRILILTHIYAFDSLQYRRVRSGTMWTECHFKDGEWREWCGKANAMNTNTIDPIAWATLPEFHHEDA